MHPIRSVGLVLCLLSSAASGQRQVVNVDFGNRGGTYVGQGVIADPGRNVWNGLAGSGANLLASDGTPTQISVSVTSDGNFVYANGNSLLADYLYVSGFGQPVGDLRITGLKASTRYLIYVFSAGDNIDQAGVIQLQGTLGCTTGSVSNQFLAGANYVVLDVESDANGVLAGTYRPLDVYAGLNGLQITEGRLPPRVVEIEGAASPVVHSPGDPMRVRVTFSEPVTLTQVGGAELRIDVDGTAVSAIHAGATTGTSLLFEAPAPATTSMNARVVADSLRLLGGARLLDGQQDPVGLGHRAAALPNDQISVRRLAVYPAVPGLAPSAHYRFRVREVGGAWQPAFAWFTKCIDFPTNEYGYYSQFIGGWSHTYCNFEMANNVPVEVEITRLDPVRGVQIDISTATPHPRRKVRSWRVDAGRVYVTIDKPVLFAVDIDGRLDGYDTTTGPLLNEKAIHGVSVFANPFILDKPDLSDPEVLAVDPGVIPPDDGPWKTLYFKPGIHQLYPGTWKFGDDFRLRSGRSYYIPGDAIVHGNMNNRDDASDARKIRIFGHGTLSGERIDHPQHLQIPQADHARSRPIRVGGGAKGCRVEGVTLADPAHHACALVGGFHGRREDYNYVRWTKVLGWRANSDGLSPNGSSYLEDCFIRTQDDGTYVSGLGIRRNVYWHDVNGMPLRCSHLTLFNDAALRKDPLYVEDIDVIYARTHFGGGAGRSVIGYPDPENAFPGTTGSRVVFRNIHVEDLLPTRMLIGWNLSEGKGQTGGSGAITGVRFENVRAAARNIAGERDVLVGDGDAPISGLIFDNVTVGGEHLDERADFVTNSQVSGLVFRNTAPQTMVYRNTSGYGKWYRGEDWDSGVEPANNDVVGHTAIGEDLVVDAPAYAGSLRVAHPNTATVSIREGGRLTVASTVVLGGAGDGRLELLDGTLRIESGVSTALSVSTGKIHLERGEILWAGDHVLDVAALYAANAITFSNGRRPPGGSAQATRIGVFGSTCLYADYDAASGLTRVFAVEPVSSIMILGLAAAQVPFGPDPRDELYVANVVVTLPVSPATIPALDVPPDPTLNGLELFFQVGMINPVFHPSDPIQLSNGLKAVIGGPVTSYGTGSGIVLSAASGPVIGQPFQLAFRF